MDVKSKIYAAWNSYLHHTFYCKYKERWLGIFLTLVVKEWNERRDPRLPQIISMCNSLAEQLFRDVKELPEEEHNFKLSVQKYFLKGRGWKLLASLLACDVKVLSCPQNLVEILLSLSLEVSHWSEDRDVPRQLSLSWPLTKIRDCFIEKNPTTSEEDLEEDAKFSGGSKTSRRKAPDDTRQFSSVSCHPISCDDEDNHHEALTENLSQEKKIMENEDPIAIQRYESSGITVASFYELIIALLEKLTDFHGLAEFTVSKVTISRRVYNFCLDSLSSVFGEMTQRRLLRALLVSTAVLRRTSPRGPDSPGMCDDFVPRILQSAVSSPQEFSTFCSEAVYGTAFFLTTLTEHKGAVDDLELTAKILRQFCMIGNLNFYTGCIKAKPKILILIGTVLSSLTQLVLRRSHQNICSKRRHKLCSLGKFHHADSLGNPFTDPAHPEENPCIPAFLYCLLWHVYRNSESQDAQNLALVAMGSAGPCCCLPPDLIYSGLFSRVGEAESHVKALTLVFLRMGFSCGRGEQCGFCRRNSGFDLERYEEAGEYTADEALLAGTQSAAVSPTQPWDCFSLYSKAILDNLEDSRSLFLARNIAFLVSRATPHVQMQLFSRVVHPLISGSVAYLKETPQDRSSTCALVFRTVWTLLPSLVADKKICDVFILGDGIDAVLELCHLPSWAADAAGVLRVLAVNELRSEQEQKGGHWHLVEMQEIVPKDDPVPEKVVEASALDLFEYLLSSHVVFVLHALDCREEMEILRELSAVIDGHSARAPIANIVLTSTQDRIDQEDDEVKKAAALWEAATQLAVTFPPFLNFLHEVSLTKAAQCALYAVTRQILTRDRNLKSYYDLIECFLTVSLIGSRLKSGRIDEECGLKLLELAEGMPSYHPGFRNLSSIVLRTATLERWLRGPKTGKKSDVERMGSLRSRRNPSGEDDSGYMADAEPCPMIVDPNKGQWTRLTQKVLFFPRICARLIRDLILWHEKCQGNPVDLNLFKKDAYTIVSKFYRICCLPLNAAILNREKMIPVILDHLKPFLVSEEQNLPIANLLLKAVCTMAEQHFTSKDLSLFIGLFKVGNPPISQLLPVCRDLIGGIALQPTSILEFPQKRVLDKADWSTRTRLEANQDIVNICNSAKDFGQVHFEKGLGSAWKTAAVFIPVLATSNWSLRTHGFSISFWFYIVASDSAGSSYAAFSSNHLESFDQNDPGWLEASLEFDTADERPKEGSSKLETEMEPNPELHLLSAGTKHSLLELWSDPQTESVIVRMTESTKSQSRCLAAQSLGFKAKSGQWHHLMFSCRDQGSARTGQVRIAAVLDGLETADLILNVPFSNLKAAGHAHLLLGTALGPSEPCQTFWYLGNVMAFRGENVSKEKALHLYALGPDCAGLTTTQESPPLTNFQTILRPEMVKAGINWNALFEETGNLRTLQENLLLVYSAHTPDSVYLYPVVASPAAGLLGSLFSGSQGAFSVVSSDPRPSQHAPMKVPVARTVHLKPHVHTGLPAAVRHLGGYPFFLFLMARIVELDATEEQQAMALEILLSYLRTDPVQMRGFRTSDGLSMLRHLFRTDKCRIGKHFAKILVNACCSGIVVRYRPPPAGSFRVSLTTCAVISDPYLLVQGLRMWNVWQRKKDDSVLELFLESIKTLVRDSHPHRAFNVMQLQRCHITDALLQIAKENLLYREGQPLSDVHSLLIAELLGDLLGSPPDVSVIAAIMDYLLLTHPAACTYVISDWDNFFFLFTQPEASKSAAFDGRTWAMPRVPSADAECGSHVDAKTFSKALSSIQVKRDNSEHKDEPAHAAVNPNQPASSEEIPRENGHAIHNGDHVNKEREPVKPASGHRQRRRSRKKEIVEIGEWQVISHSLNQCNVSRADCALGSRLREKLLDLLVKCLRFIPDYSAEQLIGRIINPEFLVVMLNYPDEGVRAATIRLLSAAFQRSESEASKFIKQNGILLLASQMQHQPITFQVVEACLGICVGIETNFETMADPLSLWPQDLNSLQLQGILLLVAALPDSVVDPPLLHNLVSLFRTLASSSNTMLRWMIDCGLLEAIGKTLIILGHTSPGRTDIFGQRGDELLVEGLQRLILTIITRCLGVSGQCQWHVFQDFLFLLLYLERLEETSGGPNARSGHLLSETCCIIVRQAMESMESMLRSRNDSGFYNGEDVLHSGKDHFAGLSDKLLASSLPLGSTRKLHFDKIATKNELSDRFKFLITKGTDIAVHVIRPEGHSTDVEINFTKGFFLAVLQGFSLTVERTRTPVHLITSDWSHFPVPDPDDSWASLLWTSRDLLKSQLSRLILFLLNPTQDPSLQSFVIKAIQQDPFHERVLRMLIANSETVRQDLDSYLCRILLCSSPEEMDQGTFLRIQCLLKLLSPKMVNGASKKYYQLPEPEEILQRYREERQAWWRSLEDQQWKILQRFENVYKTAFDSGNRMTRDTVDAQNALRKNFMEVLRNSYGNLTTAPQSWDRLIADLTHERAPWFFPESWINTWRMSPVEGPQRMHLRLERSPLNIDDKYFLPESKRLTLPEQHQKPLSFLLKKPANERIERLVLRGKVRSAANCWLVTVAEDIRGEMILSENCVYFMPDSSSKMTTHLSWDFKVVREMWKRRYEHQDRAIELFTEERQVFFFALDSTPERNLVYKELQHCLPRLIANNDLADVTQLWRDGLLTNFEYLTYLNKAAGRSFNDLMQYPIFPFVLSEYSGKDLNLDDPKVYRNFRRPIAVQHPDQEAHYIETYNYLKRSAESGGEASKCGPVTGPFHYGSLYSNPGIVLHYLVRLPPFTQLFIQYQDRNFDIPDRTFHSLETAWRLSSSESTTDVKELIPEFFYNPQFLTNDCGFNFGVRQSGEPVNHVILPPWAQKDPRMFTLIHRQALESHWVRDHLHHWIDLIFGYKQCGAAAVEALNVFHPATSSSFEAQCDDPIECSARRTMIRTYGQLPRLLFRTPHPMSSQQLTAGTSSRSRSLLPQVENITWGSFVGSPTQQDPVVTWMESYPLAVNSFLTLEVGDTYAMGPLTAALISYSYEGSILGKPSGIPGAALVLWGHPDGTVRLKLRKDQPAKPILQLDPNDPVVLCEATPNGKSLWIAFSSGSLTAYSYAFDPTRPQFEFSASPRTLIGHRGKITTLKLNSDFGIAVSGSVDGLCIVWDLYKFGYVQAFHSQTDGECPVRHVAIGSTLGNIAIVYEKNNGHSLLELRTVNGKYVGFVESQCPISAVAMSSAPEGISINVVAAGLSNGTIRLWNTWNLAHVRDIVFETLHSPIICVAFSSDAQQLFASTPDGKVIVWELPSSKRLHKQPPFLNLTLH